LDRPNSALFPVFGSFRILADPKLPTFLGFLDPRNSENSGFWDGLGGLDHSDFVKNLKNQLKMKCPKVSQIFASGKNLEKSGQIFVLTSIKFYQISITRNLIKFYKIIKTSFNIGFYNFKKIKISPDFYFLRRFSKKIDVSKIHHVNF
jgi:hypothetical protein